MDILTSVHIGKRLHSQTCMLHFSAKHHKGNAGSQKLHILRTGQSISRFCSGDPTGITSDGVKDLTRIKGCSITAHCTVSGQSISCKL